MQRKRIANRNPLASKLCVAYPSLLDAQRVLLEALLFSRSCPDLIRAEKHPWAPERSWEALRRLAKKYPGSIPRIGQGRGRQRRKAPAASSATNRNGSLNSNRNRISTPVQATQTECQPHGDNLIRSQAPSGLRSAGRAGAGLHAAQAPSHSTIGQTGRTSSLAKHCSLLQSGSSTD